MWSYTASKAWLEMQYDKDSKATEGSWHPSPHRAGERADSAIVAINNIRLSNTGNDSRHSQILE